MYLRIPRAATPQHPFLPSITHSLRINPTPTTGVITFQIVLIDLAYESITSALTSGSCQSLMLSLSLHLDFWPLTAIVFSRSTLWLSAPGLVSKSSVGNALAFLARTYETSSLSSPSIPATYTRVDSLSHRNTDRPTQHPAANHQIQQRAGRPLLPGESKRRRCRSHVLQWHCRLQCNNRHLNPVFSTQVIYPVIYT